MGKFFLLNMFVYSCNAQNNNFYNSIMCNCRVTTPQNCGRRFVVIIAEATSGYITSSGSVRDDEGSSTTTRELIITITYNCQVFSYASTLRCC